MTTPIRMTFHSLLLLVMTGCSGSGGSGRQDATSDTVSDVSETSIDTSGGVAADRQAGDAADAVPIDLKGYTEYEVVNLGSSLWCRPKYCPPGESTPNGRPCPPIYTCIDPETGEEYSNCKLFDDGPSMVCPVERGPAEIEVPDCVPDEGAVCCNPQTGGCSDDSWAILQCKPDGSGWEMEDCMGVDDEKTTCLFGIDAKTGGDVAYCGVCIPGETTCQDEVTVYRCGYWGLGWEFFQECPGPLTCEWGICI